MHIAGSTKLDQLFLSTYIRMYIHIYCIDTYEQTYIPYVHCWIYLLLCTAGPTQEVDTIRTDTVKAVYTDRSRDNAKQNILICWQVVLVQVRFSIAMVSMTHYRQEVLFSRWQYIGGTTV